MSRAHLKLIKSAAVVPPPHAHTRDVRTEYSGAADAGRVAASASLEGAIRQAVTRLLQGQYEKARIGVIRGPLAGPSEGELVHLVTVSITEYGVSIRWYNANLFPRAAGQRP